MPRETCSRVLDAIDERAQCDACDLGAPVVVRRYYVHERAHATIDLCDACARSLSRAVERATA